MLRSKEEFWPPDVEIKRSVLAARPLPEEGGLF
jgi:hypothetical protein